jgi:hypothetical protein
MRADVYFTLQAEEYILRRAERMKNRQSLVKEVIVLFNVLGVERKNQFGQVVKKDGPFVYVGLERHQEGLEVTTLPNSGMHVYLSGFAHEREITINITKGHNENETRLCVELC